jgi:xanthine dehydrogenase YagS FAD-binding subunit
MSTAQETAAMKFSRRNFLKAASQGIALSAVGIGSAKRVIAALSFEKLRPRGVWDFAMASLGLNQQVRNNVIEDARVVFGGIAGRPLREKAVEAFLKGKRLSTQLTSDVLPQTLVDAAPLKYNAMKIEMAKGLLASGLEKLRA